MDESWLKGISARLDRLEMRAPSPEMMMIPPQHARRASSNGQRAPSKGEGRIYGAKYTQRLTLHKEITTFSPDRSHLPVQKPPPMPNNYQSVRISEDENYFGRPSLDPALSDPFPYLSDDRSEDDLDEEQQQQASPQHQQQLQVKQRRGTQSDRERRDRYRK